MSKDICLFERKELKYLISQNQLDNLLLSIGSHIRADEYHKYTICNLYMDTPDYRLIRRSLEKPVYKEKLRLRSYGPAGDSSGVYVELKKKYKGIVYKRRVKMPLGAAMAFIGGGVSGGTVAGNALTAGKSQIEREIRYFLDQNEGIMPAMYISYDREAYSGCDDTELRITFDGNILWREEYPDLAARPYGHSLLSGDERLMEIKCAGSMPLWLTEALSENRIYQTSFSKYGKAYAQRLSVYAERKAG